MQTLLVAQRREKVVTTTPGDPLWAVSTWVCIASAVTTAPSMSNGSSRTGREGISLDLSATRCWVSTALVAWSKAARR